MKLHLSTTSSDEEEKTFTEIIRQCTEAAAADRIYSTDHANCHTVHFWATSVARALPKHKGEQEEEDNSCHAAVRESFGKLLTKLLLNSKCYEHLEKFEALYKTLEDKGVKLPNTSVPVRKLMLYKIDSDSTLGVEGVELSAQRRFFGSTLWNQFEKQRAVTLLGRAKNEEHGEKRDRLLKLWDAVPDGSLCPETKANVDMARSLFLSTLPLPSRVSFALGDETRVTFAAGWKADFDFSTLKYFRTTPSTWDGLTVAGFTETYNFILINDMKDLVTNAVMKTILDYGVSLPPTLRRRRGGASS